MNDLPHAFPGQEKDEAIFVFARRTPIAFIPVFLLFLIVYTFSYFAEYLIAQPAFISFSTHSVLIGIAGLGVFRLLALTGFLIVALNFYLDIIIVTNERLVEINQEQLFSRQISELDLIDIEDVSSDVQGFFPSLFNYGTVFVQTAGAQDKFIMKYIRYPREIAALTLSLSEQAKRATPGKLIIPETDIIGVVNNTPYRNLADLQAIGAVPADLTAAAPTAPPPDAPV